MGADEIGTQQSQSQRMGQEEMVIRILGRRQGTARWLNDPVWRHGVMNGRVERRGCGHPPQT